MNIHLKSSAHIALLLQVYPRIDEESETSLLGSTTCDHGGGLAMLQRQHNHPSFHTYMNTQTHDTKQGIRFGEMKHHDHTYVVIYVLCSCVPDLPPHR